MVKQLMPRAALEPRPSDIRLSDEQYNKLSLFAQLKRKPTLDKFPGAMIVRHYKKGEMLFRQGEAGWTAFYILTSEDVLGIHQQQLQALPPRDNDRRKNLQYEVALLEQRVAQLKAAPDDDDLRTMATVYLAVARNPRAQRSGLTRLMNMQGRPMQGAVKNADQKTFYIPVDGPMTLNYDSLRAPLKEGELFGEMSCMYRTPRSATVVARRECYVIEILRNILDQIQKDPVYKARTDEIYKKRVFELQLRKLSVFSDLTDQEFNEVRDGVELESVEPGTLICDEHDRSDSMYIVRSGLVKVMKNVSALLGPEDVPDWGVLLPALREGESQPAGPRGKVWQLLPERIRAIVRTAADPLRLNNPDRLEVIGALNDVVKAPKLADAKEFKAVLETSPLREAAADLLQQRAELLKKKKDWPDVENRRFNRMLLEAVYPDKAVRRLTREGGPETILSYCSRGDFFGEMGLMLNQPRSASCIAYGHPNDYGQVELVRLPGRVFWKLVKNSPAIREKVKQEIAVRRKRTVERLLTPVWDDTNQVQFSERFEELGLIQGQKLMLIDLDRCTRCDECVKACVATHDDGRTRLFLDGPRFGKYLVPTTCRSCLDPVCMIGCPVGSIHRGDNREIVIEDWCIGCSLCSDSCPYGSIQMHDLGIIPENARGWSYLPAPVVKGDKWRKAGFVDASWLHGDAPFTLDRELQEQLASRRPAGHSPMTGDGAVTNFRYEFHLTREMLRADELKLEVTSMAPTVTVWVNNHEVTPDDKPKRGRREYTLSLKAAAKGEEKKAPLTAGANVLAVQVTPTANATEVLLQARLDEVRRPALPDSVDEEIAEEITEKLVTQRAVVCDLCSTLPGQRPACVQACPHDAAMRVNARFEFPVK
jgi:CRP-like cAMP-binding protein